LYSENEPISSCIPYSQGFPTSGPRATCGPPDHFCGPRSFLGFVENLPNCKNFKKSTIRIILFEKFRQRRSKFGRTVFLKSWRGFLQSSPMYICGPRSTSQCSMWPAYTWKLETYSLVQALWHQKMENEVQKREIFERKVQLNKGPHSRATFSHPSSEKMKVLQHRTQERER
jgi:hypothetical protein